MKQIRFAIFVAALTLSAAACVNLEVVPAGSDGSNVITATIEQDPVTKTTLSGPGSDGIYYPFWSSGDAIAVYADGVGIADKYTLNAGVGASRGSFIGRLSGQSLTGLYPYSSRGREGFKDGRLSLVLPSVQEYREGTFADGSFPMAGIGKSGVIEFRNLCSVLKLSITGEDAVQAVRFIAHDGRMKLSGNATVDLSNPSEPVLIMAEDASNELSVDCGFLPLNPSVPTDFFLVIPPGTYAGGFSIEIRTFRGTVTKSTVEDITFRRSQLRSIPVFECKADGEVDLDNLPYNEIRYVTYNGGMAGVCDSCTNSTVVSHTYENGQGIIKFSGPVTEIKRDGLFYSRYNIKEIYLPNSVSSIGEYGFSDCNLLSFHTPDKLESVGDFCFARCNSLASITGKWASTDGKAIILENGSLVAYAPAGMPADFSLPNGVRSVSPGVFEGNGTIRNLVIPEGVESLRFYSFHNCASLETVTLPQSLTAVESSTFDYCHNLREFKGAGRLLADSRTMVANGNLVAFAGAGVKDYTLPAGIESIYGQALCGWSELRSLTLPASLQYLTTSWLNYNDKLEFLYGPGTSEDHHCYICQGDCLAAVTSVCPSDYKIPGNMGIKRIMGNVFEGNPSIERLTIPDEVSKIEGYAFHNMPRLKSIVLPAGLTECGWSIFAQSMSIDTIWIRSATPPSYTEDDYGHIGHDGLTVYVPAGTEELYKSAPGWSAYAKYIKGYSYPDL